MPSYGRKSVEGRANLQDVKNACMILNTAEYCQSTSLQARRQIFKWECVTDR